MGTEMLWGIDISHHQGAGFNFGGAGAEGFDFAFLKATEGAGWVDGEFAANLDAVRGAGLLVAAYHYQRPDDAQSQVDHIASVIPTDVPVILDVEDGSGSIALTRDLIERLRAAGYTVPLLYLPRWYWQQRGSPDLSGLPPLWSSRYPDMDGGTATAIYERVPDQFWNGYGGLEVAVLQFTSSATVAGHATIDTNAYTHGRNQLATLLANQEDEMSAETQEQIAQMHASVSRVYDETGLDWAEALIRVLRLFPYIDTDGIAERDGHSAGDLTNATHSTWERLFFDTDPRVTAIEDKQAEQDIKLDQILTAVSPQRPAKSARKADWINYAVAQGMARDEAEDMTKDELIDEYGDE